MPGDAPPIRPFPLQAGHPANHGFAQCPRCGRWLHPRSLTGAVCTDVAACSEQARLSGRLDLNAVPPAAPGEAP